MFIFYSFRIGNPIAMNEQQTDTNVWTAEITDPPNVASGNQRPINIPPPPSVY